MPISLSSNNLVSLSHFVTQNRSLHSWLQQNYQKCFYRQFLLWYFQILSWLPSEGTACIQEVVILQGIPDLLWWCLFPPPCHWSAQPWCWDVGLCQSVHWTRECCSPGLMSRAHHCQWIHPRCSLESEWSSKVINKNHVMYRSTSGTRPLKNAMLSTS